MSIRSRFIPYALRVMRGDIFLGQLVNLARSRILPKAETVSWQPTHISIFVTDRCNFHCDMCPTHSRKVPTSYPHCHRVASDMSLDLFRFIVDRYPNAVRLWLVGTGEPLLNPNLFDLVREAAKRRMVVSTISNGYAIDDYITEILSSSLDQLCISLDGHTGEEFHRMTGNPERYHSRILRNVEALVGARRKKNAMPRIEVSFIIDSRNYRYMKDMINVGENLGADSVLFLSFQPNPFPGFTPEERCIYADDSAVCEELASLMSKKYRCDVTWPFLLKRQGDGITVCRWPFSMFQVDGDGCIGGCGMGMLNMHDNGRVYEKDPWNNEYFRDLRRRHLQNDLFWPCKFCVESVGLEPSLAVKTNLRF